MPTQLKWKKESCLTIIVVMNTWGHQLTDGACSFTFHLLFVEMLPAYSRSHFPTSFDKPSTVTYW